MELLIAPLIFIAAVIYVAYPLLRDKPEEPVEDAAEMTESEQLTAQKDDLVANLKDIEMDYQMGKLTDDDYQNLKAEFQARAVDVLRRLEEAEQRPARRKS